MNQEASVALAQGAPFDGAAATYDATFTDTRLGRLLREAVWARLARHFQPGMRILELNCGTGEDAIWLARRGLHVTATDSSPAMLAVAQAKAERAGVADRVVFRLVDLARSGDWRVGNRDWGGRFDGVLSNFGGLNCVADRRPLAASLARVVRPGGRVALVVMGPLYPWEVAWHLAHGEVRTAFRRFRSGVEARVGDGAAVRVWYPAPRRLRGEFAPCFRHLETVGIGLLLPPSYLDHLVEQWSRLFELLASADRRLGDLPPAAWLSDHYLSVFERRRDD